MEERKPFYITTAIPYASRKPHFGNTYEVIMTDAVARFRRATGYDVCFGTGTDEHGQKIEDLAKETNTSPKKYVDNVVGEIKGIWDKMGSSYDHFVRTTDDYHEDAVSKIFKRFYEQGDIYKDQYEGWYCTPCESFFTNTQVVDGKCPDCGRPVKMAREEAYKFKMSKYADRLLKHIEDNPDFIQPESRKKEMVNNFLKVEGGLQDLCVSRTSFTWGVKTFDPKHVCYVWIDALSNYITGLGYDPEKSYEEQSEKFKKYWPCDAHIIGKDILRFHTIYWPIFLMALGLPLPKKIFGHPWFLFGTDKMSKSKGNVIYADALADRFSVDGVRYYALAEMPFNSDGSITYESFIKVFNTDLVNNLGNLVKRTLDMQKKYFNKEILEPNAPDKLDDELKNACIVAKKQFIEQMNSYHVADACATIIELLNRANKYIDETTPWSLAKDPSTKDRLATVLYTLLCTIRWAAVMLHPLIPDSSETILNELNCQEILPCFTTFPKTHQTIDFSTFIGDDMFASMKVGSYVNDSTVLFARIDEEKVLAELEEERIKALEAMKANEIEKPEGLALIGIDQFAAVELRCAQILDAEPIPKAKKLLKLQIDLGYEKRQVVSGIAKYYQPDQLIGKKIVLVVNLKPVVLCGVESNGMILASGEEDVRVIFLDPDTKLGDRIH